MGTLVGYCIGDFMVGGEMRTCKHEDSRIWEPHLAGARKCNDCGWVKSPNRAYAGCALWFDEEKELEEAERKKLEELKEKYED